MTAVRRKYPPSPTPAQIRQLRDSVKGLTQVDAAALVYTTERTWQCWELGTRQMHPALWELFTGKIARKMRAMRGASALPPGAPGPTKEC